MFNKILWNLESSNMVIVKVDIQLVMSRYCRPAGENMIR